MNTITHGDWTLAHKSGAICCEGERVTDFRGDEATLTGWRPAHKRSSTGFVNTAGGAVYYPGVFDLQWIQQGATA